MWIFVNIHEYGHSSEIDWQLLSFAVACVVGDYFPKRPRGNYKPWNFESIWFALIISLTLALFLNRMKHHHYHCRVFDQLGVVLLAVIHVRIFLFFKEIITQNRYNISSNIFGRSHMEHWKLWARCYLLQCWSTWNCNSWCSCLLRHRIIWIRNGTVVRYTRYSDTQMGTTRIDIWHIWSGYCQKWNGRIEVRTTRSH